ncbi:unnamed protein product [Camellia sinensis]
MIVIWLFWVIQKLNSMSFISIYKVFDLKTYMMLYSISDKNVQEIKIRNRTVAVWNFRGELGTSFEDHLLWHPDCNTNNIYITRGILIATQTTYLSQVIRIL